MYNSEPKQSMCSDIRHSFNDTYPYSPVIDKFSSSVCLNVTWAYGGPFPPNIWQVPDKMGSYKASLPNKLAAQCFHYVLMFAVDSIFK